jgi:hypothetical protein
MFGSDIASDYAVIWDCVAQRSYTVAPSGITYSNAVLLGWSQSQPDRVLFKAGQMGEEAWSLWSVDHAGQTQSAPADQAMIYGDVVHHLWAGPQARR